MYSNTVALENMCQKIHTLIVYSESSIMLFGSTPRYLNCLFPHDCDSFAMAHAFTIGEEHPVFIVQHQRRRGRHSKEGEGHDGVFSAGLSTGEIFRWGEKRRREEKGEKEEEGGGEDKGRCTV